MANSSTQLHTPFDNAKLSAYINVLSAQILHAFTLFYQIKEHTYIDSTLPRCKKTKQCALIKITNAHVYIAMIYVKSLSTNHME